MVEKVSESIAKSIAKIDVSSAKNDFLDLINKKKKDKKPADMHDMAAVVLGHIPQLLNNSATHGGGTKSTDALVTANAKQSLSHLLLEETSDKALRKKILAAAGQHSAGVKSPHDSALSKDNVSVSESTAKSHDKAVAAALANVSAQSGTLNKASVQGMEDASERIRSLSSRQIEADLAAVQSDVTDAALMHRGQAATMQFSAAASSGAPRNETAARTEKVPVQTVNTQAASGEVKEKQAMDLNYQFQRWSGDHSVKVSIPTDIRGDSKITMQPSDTRAADALSRHISQLPGQKVEVLHTALAVTDPRTVDNFARMTAQPPEPAQELYHAQHDSEERERQRQHNAQEEEQE